MKPLSWWWPTPERLHEVLLGDAEAHRGAVALAVHQPMHILRRHHDEPIDSDGAEVVDEGALLARLMEPVGDGCQVVLIEGKSGTGKSHVVRWLEIQLDRRADRSSRVVLPVGKGSRLRDIVRNLSERPELAGPKHAALRQQLAGAQEPIAPRDAASRLCQQLAFVCETRAEEALKKRRQGLALTEMEELFVEWGGRTQLPHLLVYNLLRPYFVEKGKPMQRLVEHLHAKADPLSPRTEQEIIDTDLTIEDPPEELDDLARKVLHRLEDPERRSQAVRVLNDALDEAKRILLNLNPGVVQEVLKSIRRELLDLGKELVLLIEDFADLSGLQREVLQASIQTGSPGGIRAFCTLRTVLAYTDGLLRETTVLSRAQYVYYVPNQIRETQVVTQSVRLVGSYLRAARFGAAELERAMRESPDAESWLPAAPETSDDDRRVLEAFGAPDGIPLFPFSPRAVERLVRDMYAGKPALLFVPRDIIRELMPRVLNHREAFMKGIFPPEAFRASRGAQMSDDARRWLVLANPQGSMRKRLETFLVYWGLNPGAARAFKLPEPDMIEAVPPPARGDEQPGAGTGSSEPPKHSVSPELFAEDRQRFEEWRAGTDITSPPEQRRIRNAIDTALRSAAAWAWYPRIEKPSAVKERWAGWQEGIDIAGLRLASDAIPLLFVSSEEREDRLANEAFVREFVAVCGSAQTKTWDVEGIEMHLAPYLSFVERHRPTVERHLLGFWHLRQWDALPFLVRALAATGAILGIPNCGSSIPQEFIDALFADPSEATVTESAWCRDVSTPLRALRTSLRDMLKRETGAFQGDGTTVHGIDAARLLPFVPALKGEPAAPPAVPLFPPGAGSNPDIKAVRETAAILGKLDSATNAELAARRALAARVRAAVPSREEKDALGPALHALLQNLTDLTEIAGEQTSDMRSAITALRKAALVEPLESTDALASADASLWQRLVSLGRNDADNGRLMSTERILTKIDVFLRDEERRRSGVTEIDPLDEALAAHEMQLTEARKLLGSLTENTASGEAS